MVTTRNCLRCVLFFSLAHLWTAYAEEEPTFHRLTEPPLVVGPSYEISEPDMILEIQAKLKADKASGVLDAKISEGIERAKRSIVEPPPVAGLSLTEKRRSFLWDPTVYAEHDVVDPYSGKVVVPAGTRLNPLDKMAWPGLWLFLDASQPEQLAWARMRLASTELSTTIVLVGGDVAKTSKLLQRQIFFDQGGVLVRKFAISHTPATVQQEGSALRVTEELTQ